MRHLVLVALLPLVAPQDPVDRILDRKISVDFNETEIKDVAAFLQDTAGLTVVVDRRAANAFSAINLKLTDVPIRSVLRWIGTLNRVEFTIANGAVVFVSPDHPGTALETRLFEIGGLTSRPADFPAPAPADAARSPVVVLEGSDVRGTPEDSTMDLIKRAVSPSSWDSDDVSIQTVQPGRISVRHYPAVLDEIDRFLAALRKLAPAMITIEADVFELDADAEKRIDGLYGRAVDAEAAKTLLEALQPLRRAKTAETLRLTCSEGQLTHVLVSSQRAMRGHAAPLPLSTVLEVRPALAGKAVKLDLAVRSTRLVEPVEKGESVDLPETVQAAMRTVLTVPHGGAAVLLLPRVTRHPRALILRPTASNGAAGEIEFGTASAAALPGLDKPAISVDFRDTSGSDVAQALRNALGINVVLHPDVRSGSVTLKLKDVKPRAALELLCGVTGWEMAAMNDALYLAPASAMRRVHHAVWLANIRDLSLSALESRNDETWQTPAAYDPYGVADLVSQSVQPRTWGESGIFCEATANGLLLVRHSPRAIGEVRSFLDALRKRAGGLVALRAEVVTVKSDAADDVLAHAESGGYLVDADAAAKLIQAAVAPAERLQLDALVGRRAGISWERRRTTLVEKTPKIVETRSLVDLLPIDGRLTINVESQEFAGSDQPARAVVRTSVALPAAKAAVFKLGSDEGQQRLLVLRAETR